MPSIEYVTVANHAEAINGLLYLQGAGWTEVRPQVLPDGQLGIVHFGIALSVLIGWNETNQRYPLLLQITSEDGGDPLVQAEGVVEQGRPSGVVPGQDLRSVLALNAEVQFPRPGGYEVRVTLGDAVRTVSFRVVGPEPQVAPGGPASFRLPPDL